MTKNQKVAGSSPASALQKYRDLQAKRGVKVKARQKRRADLLQPYCNPSGKSPLYLAYRPLLHVRQHVRVCVHQPELDLPASLGDAAGRKLTVKLDWYPKIGALVGTKSGTVTAVRDTGKLEARHLAFMNLDEVYFELVRHKEERGWHNLTLSREKMVELLENPDWYELTIPSDDLEFGPGSLGRRVRAWQEVAIALLKAYCKKYYDTRRNEYESAFLEYQELTEKDDNFLEEYRFQVETSAEDYLRELRDLKTAVEDGRMKPVSWGALDIFSFDQHLYRPLVHLKNKDVSVKPVALNEGEQQFVRDLKAFYKAQPEVFEERELYLLRNMSRGKGIGFFEAGNFYPDFILWLVVGGQQNVAFVDPKGIRNLQGLTDPKIEFYKTIKEIERRLDDPSVTLNSFIISNTPYEEVAFWGSKNDLEERHVLFQQEGQHTYIKKMLDKIFSANMNVNAMWQRYRRYHQGKEPLLSIAYFCLSCLEATAMSSPLKGKYSKTAGTYHVEEKVINKLGELSSTVGDEVSARKMDGQSRGRPPTSKETTWVEAALELLINRAAEHAADPNKQWSQITMDDLPKL